MSAPSRPSWDPFQVAPAGTKPWAPRSIETLEGVGDRLRAAAFAEIQAREAFLWASNRFGDAPESLRRAWVALASAEDRHLNWLLTRMQELGIALTERPVSDHLWDSFLSCQDARTFSHYMANAEERGRRAGERFFLALEKRDPITAEIFRKIAEEEVAHIALAHRYFPLDPNPLAPRDVAS